MYTIYKISNTVDGKCYIGFTSQNPPRNRWARHKGDARNGSELYIHRAIRKYGKDNFLFVILEQGQDKNYGLTVAEPGYIAAIPAHEALSL